MKVFVKTFGCSANLADSHLMETLIHNSKNYTLVNNIEDSDVVIINSCTVKQNAETKFWKTIRESKKLGKKVVAAGCVPQADKLAVEKLVEQGIPVLGVRDVDKVIEILDALAKGKVLVINDSINKSYHDFELLPDSVIGIVPINEGCLGNCTYCKTKFSRGNLLSYPPDRILSQIENFLSKGVKEIWITSQDSGAYGYDLKGEKYLLPHLLKDILAIPKDFKIRLGMMNPNHAEKIIDDILELMANDDRIFRFLHIPIQSASDKVLRDMNRLYDSKTIYDLFSKIRAFDEKLTISTDVICGFPTECEEDFDETFKFVETFQPEILNISRFWPRPGTKAAELKPLYNQVPIQRAKKIRTLFREYSFRNQKKWLGWQGYALIDEVGKNNSLIARNDYYKQIVIKDFDKLKSDELKDVTFNETANSFLGKRIKVKVVKTTCFDLRAEVL